ncbi:unnamed protein product [Mytilus edulis]|uniref:Ig-like domain-containing protein n=1 Tax=Mytilus edulis TaxID=6550 RepID=A0A8S3RAR3_MYTED|nr:unnamed protein product [Mytilus edulis]
MTIFGDEHNTVYAQVGQNKTLLCKITSGIPNENLIWRRHNEILAWGTGEVEYNFTAKQSDNLKELVCEARQIDKPAIYIIADPRTHVHLGENITLMCIIENPVKLKSIFWLKNGDILLNASSIFQIVNLEIDDTGMYICKATNKIGNSSAVINIGLIPEIQSTEARYETIEEMDIGDLQQPEIPGIPTANSENLTISTDGYELECYRNSDLSSTEHSSCNSNYQYCTNSYESVHVADLFVNGDHSYESVLREKQYEGKKTLKKIKSAPF